MRPPSFHPPAKRYPKGFTLLELLAVVVIIVLILTFALPAVNSLLRGSQITQAGQLIGDQFALARQTALSKNRSVEVRFYQYGDSEIPGENPADASTGSYRAVQSFEMLDSGSAIAVGKIQRLPSSIIIDSGATLSPLLGITLNKTWTTLDPQIKLPRIGTAYNCRAFRFQPDGSTTLSPGGAASWFLTMHNLTDGDGLSAPSKNFFTIQLDAINAHLKIFRP